MLNAFWWVLTAEAIGLATFPLAYYLFPRLTDRGYTLSKPLGILLIGYASWILSVLHILPSVRLSLIALLLVLGGISGWYAWGHRRELWRFVLRERKAIIAGEIIFLVIFVGWTIYRAYDPAIEHTEQPMDFAFLNASIESRVGPPEDPWLRGESVSYYYFGYWMMGAIAELTGIASNIAYNLSLALIPALAAIGIFGLVYNLVRSVAVRWRNALLGGVAAVVLLGVAANLEGGLEYMRANGAGSQQFWDWVAVDGLDGPNANPSESWRPEEFWWWFRATRVINTFEDGQSIDYTIEEFPFFSFMLGNLHPHVMSIPFLILFLGLLWNFYRSPMPNWSRPDVRSLVFILAMGLALGGLAFTNMWDLPVFAALFLGVAGLKTYAVRGGGLWTLAKGVVPTGAAVIGLVFLLFLPYYLTLAGSVTGIEPVAAATTRPIHLFIVWGLYLVVVVPFIVTAFWRISAPREWARPAIFSALLVLLPYGAWAFLHLEDGGTTDDLLGRFLRVLPLALLIGVALYTALAVARERGRDGLAFALVLSALGLLLIMGPELLFVGDVFSNRMNTVFKLYYQAWILLAAASGFAIYYWRFLRDTLTGWTRPLTFLWAGVFVVLLAGSLYYPATAAATKGAPFDDATLDGLTFLARTRLAEYEAIKFVKDNVDGDAAIVEAVGEWFDAGLISRSTGVPTVLNWPFHELQWRGSTTKFDGREQDVARIYQTETAEEARNLLAKYDVEYVYVGPRERAKYGSGGLSKFPSFAETVFSRDDVVIYRVRQ